MSMAIANQLLALPIWEDSISIFSTHYRAKEVDAELILHLLSGKTKNHFKPILKLEDIFF
jgi:hypothetical protein